MNWRVFWLSLLVVFAVSSSGVIAYHYYQYRRAYVATRKAVFSTSWVKGDLRQGIAYGLGWKRRFRDISFFHTQTIMCSGSYCRMPSTRFFSEHLSITLYLFLRNTDFEGIRIRGHGSASLDFPATQDDIDLHHNDDDFRAVVALRLPKDAIDTTHGYGEDLAVALTRDGVEVTDYGTLFFASGDRARDWDKLQLFGSSGGSSGRVGGWCPTPPTFSAD